MSFLLLGIDSLIACIAVGALVDRRWRACGSPRSSALADGVAFLIGAGLGWALLGEGVVRSRRDRGARLGLGLYLLVVAAATPQRLARLVGLGAAVRPDVDNLAYGLAGEQTGLAASARPLAQALSSALLAYRRAVRGRLAPARASAAERRRPRGSPEPRCWSRPVRLSSSADRGSRARRRRSGARRARRACGRRSRSRRGRTRRRDPRRATPCRACRHAPTAPHPRTAAGTSPRRSGSRSSCPRCCAGRPRSSRSGAGSAGAAATARRDRRWRCPRRRRRHATRRRWRRRRRTCRPCPRAWRRSGSPGRRGASRRRGVPTTARPRGSGAPRHRDSSPRRSGRRRS